MSVLNRICITNDGFRSPTEKRRTLESLPQPPGTLFCFTSSVNRFSSQCCSTAIKAFVWPCAPGYDFLLTTEFGSGWDVEATNDVITACVIGLSDKLHDCVTCQSSSCLSFTCLTLSVLLCGLCYELTQRESQRYSRNAVQSGLSEIEDVSVWVCESSGTRPLV